MIHALVVVEKNINRVVMEHLVNEKVKY
jgi:hypothetical protein